MFIAVCVCLFVQGLAASRDDVINLVAAASHDGSGHLHFDEFLDLMSARRLPGMDSKLAAALEDKWVFRGGGGSCSADTVFGVVQLCLHAGPDCPCDCAAVAG